MTGGLCPACLVTLALDDDEPEAGSVSAPAHSYQVVSVLGQEAGRARYLARREGYRTLVSLEIVGRAAVADSRGAIEDRLAELRALQHPSIARLLEAWDEPSGDWCLVSEYVVGRALRPTHASDTPGLFGAICEAMRWAHQHGVCHGRLQAASVVLVAGPEGVEPRLTGFSLTPVPPSIADDIAGLGTILATITAGQPSAAAAAPLVRRAAGQGPEAPFATVVELQAAFAALRTA